MLKKRRREKTMSKGDKKMGIWMDRDKECARLFCSTCHMTKDDAMALTGISENRLYTWRNLGWLEVVRDENSWCFRTTELGREKFEEQTLMKSYISSSYQHDKAFTEIMASLDKEERDSWCTEREVREMALEQGIDLEGCSVTDGAYRDSGTGEWIFVEIITKRYTEEMIEMKREFVQRMGGLYEEHYV